MSTSYGMITITDTTDLGQLSVYLTGSTVRQQVYDAGNNPPTTASYYPDWSASGAHLLITPHIYFNGESKLLSSNNIEVSWQKTEGGHTYSLPVSPTTDECPETVNNKILERPTNLLINSNGATYTATVTYYPIDGDRNVSLQGVATLDLTISNNGVDGSPGAPGPEAKALQLVGSGTHFHYTWDNQVVGTTTINLTVEKSSTIAGVHWYCDNVKITSGGSDYTALSLSVTTSNIETYSPNFSSNKSAQFKIVETDSSGNEVTNGYEDYFTIYKLQDAQPGEKTYSAYLDNDQETVNEYNGIIDFTNAITTFHLDKGGANNLVANSGWTISISDSNNITYTVGKSAFNGLPVGNNNEITSVTGMTGNTAWIQFTAHNTDSNISDQIKRFTIVKNPSLISHSLRLNYVSANRDTTAAPNGNYTPNQIEVDAIVRTGGGTDSYRTANVIEAVIYYKDETYSNTLHNTEGNPLVITLADKTASGNNPATTIDHITTSLKYNNETVDSQGIVIGRDGEDGDPGAPGVSPWNFMLSNQFDGISTDFGNNNSANFVVKLPIAATEGATEKPIYYGGQTYPTIEAESPILTNITPKYYLGDTEKTTAGSVVDNVRYVIPAGTNIGATGSITLTLRYAANQTLTQTYTYKAQPEPLKPIRVLLTANPSDTFENQEGTITITPTVLSGTTPVTFGWSNPTWQAFYNGQWVSATTITGITINDNVLNVSGSAVEGYLGLRFSVSITKGGITENYTEYINLKDIDDPLQVTLHSTVGEQIVNSQGVGVIYARVIRRGDNEDYDNVVPDNLLGIGTTVPTGSRNDGIFAGKTGYCYIVLGNNSKPTGEVRYYWRTSTSSDWIGYRGSTTYPYKYTYTWTFRNNDNEPYVAGATENPAAINYNMNSSNNTQFVYIDSSVIDNKITAVVKVEI